MAQDNAKKAKVDAILAGVPNTAPSKDERMASIARQLAHLDRQITNLQERRASLEDELIAINDAT